MVFAAPLPYVKATFGKLIEWPIKRFGYALRPAFEYQDLRHVTDDPIEGLYLSPEKPFLIDVDIEHLRGNSALGFPFARSIGHPYIDTVDAYLAGECRQFHGSPLDAFYTRWRPCNAAVTLGLDPQCASPVLRGMPPYAAMSPWFPHPPELLLSIRQAATRNENVLYGVDIGPDHGTLVNGPWSAEKGNLEFRRLSSITDSIRLKGFVESTDQNSFLNAHVMIRGADWRVKVRNGNHRLAVLVALGWTRVPVMIISMSGSPRRDEIASWPLVREGVFSSDEASSIFDRIFDGARPQDYASPTAEPPLRDMTASTKSANRVQPGPCVLGAEEG
jgi:hypothetical protein